MQARQDDRSLGELFSDLTREMSTLVRQEVALAKTEMTEKASALGKNAAMLVVGGALLYAAFLALVATAIIGLAYAMPWWLAALIVTIIVAIIGGVMARMGLENLKKTQLAPTKTVETIKEDATWIKQQAT
ncbi:MAG TPA: phage holin family protein [Ktedonobacterales bacterium]|nr:phage holin family protein [Ktedonobacterales bacterium]